MSHLHYKTSIYAQMWNVVNSWRKPSEKQVTLNWFSRSTPNNRIIGGGDLVELPILEPLQGFLCLSTKNTQPDQHL